MGCEFGAKMNHPGGLVDTRAVEVFAQQVVIAVYYYHFDDPFDYAQQNSGDALFISPFRAGRAGLGPPTNDEGVSRHCIADCRFKSQLENPVGNEPPLGLRCAQMLGLLRESMWKD